MGFVGLHVLNGVGGSKGCHARRKGYHAYGRV